MPIQKSFLIFAFCVVSIIALLYGVSPYWFARTFFGLSDIDANLAHILRAVMGLYLALGLFWLFAAFNDEYRKAAVLMTVVFAGGLVSGRIVSLFVDGQPNRCRFSMSPWSLLSFQSAYGCSGSRNDAKQ